MNNIIDLTADNFETHLEKHQVLLVDFWADWCAPCKQFANVYEEVAKLYPEVTFGKIDIAVEEELAEAFHIRSIPHLIIFKEGLAIYSESGSIPKSTLVELIDEAVKIDVSEVRKNIEK